MILFVLVGAAVDIRYTLEAGLAAVAMIFVALIFRSFGVLLCTVKTNLSAKKGLFVLLHTFRKQRYRQQLALFPLQQDCRAEKLYFP